MTRYTCLPPVVWKTQNQLLPLLRWRSGIGRKASTAVTPLRDAQVLIPVSALTTRSVWASPSATEMRRFWSLRNAQNSLRPFLRCWSGTGRNSSIPRAGGFGGCWPPCPPWPDWPCTVRVPSPSPRSRPIEGAKA